jgi:hypothetical protein
LEGEDVCTISWRETGHEGRRNWKIFHLWNDRGWQVSVEKVKQTSQHDVVLGRYGGQYHTLKLWREHVPRTCLPNGGVLPATYKELPPYMKGYLTFLDWPLSDLEDAHKVFQDLPFVKFEDGSMGKESYPSPFFEESVISSFIIAHRWIGHTMMVKDSEITLLDLARTWVRARYDKVSWADIVAYGACEVGYRAASQEMGLGEVEEDGPTVGHVFSVVEGRSVEGYLNSLIRYVKAKYLP